MAAKVLVFLLLIGVASCQVATHTEEVKINTEEDGEIRDTVETKEDCSGEKSNVTFSDGSWAATIRDRDSGLILELDSNDTDICSVRFMTEAEKELLDRCYGEIDRDNDEKEVDATNADKEEYKLLEKPLTHSILSDDMRELCEGKTLYQMVPDSDCNAEASRRKRGTRTRCYRYRICYFIRYRYQCGWRYCYRTLYFCKTLYVRCYTY